MLLSTLLCFSVVVAAQTSPTPPHSAAHAMTVPAAATGEVTLIPPGEPPVPLLWKVSDADNAVYLLGAFHMLKADDYPLSNDVNVAFADATTVVFEMPPAEMASPQLGVQMAQAALRTDGTTLDSQLPPATRDKLATWLSAHAATLQASGLTGQVLQGYEPWFVGLLVTITEMSSMGLDPALGVDRHFMDAAASAGKRTDGFETGAQQIAFLDGMSTIEQLQMLDEALSQPDPVDVPQTQATTTSVAVDDSAPVVGIDPPSATVPPVAPSETPPASIDTLHASWRAGDADGLWNGMGQQLRTSYPDLYRRINIERNDAWLPKVESMLAAPGTDDTLVVVGALHLLGGDGLVEKLCARGYAVERICSACVVTGALDTLPLKSIDGQSPATRQPTAETPTDSSPIAPRVQ